MVSTQSQRTGKQSKNKRQQKRTSTLNRPRTRIRDRLKESIREKPSKVTSIFFLVLLVVLIIFFVFIFQPHELVERIGVNNSYLVMFLVSLFGGFSAGGSLSFIATLIAFTTGGLNPIYLGLISGVALAIGDMFMFYAASKGRELIPDKYEGRIDRLAHYLHGKNNFMIEIFIFLYMALAPLPNDLLLFSLAAVKYPQKRLVIPLILGDIAFPMLIIFTTLQGYALLM